MMPTEITAYVQVVQEHKRLRDQLKQVRQTKLTMHQPVLEWMAQHDVDVLKLATTGVTIEKSDRVHTAPLTKDLRLQLLHHYFAHVDNPMTPAEDRAQALSSFLDNRDHRPSRAVTTLSCRVKG